MSVFYKNERLNLGSYANSTEIGDESAPVYLYKKSLIKEAVDTFKNEIPEKGKLFYAVKANSNLEILKYLKSLGMGLDIVSGGEMQKGLDAGFSPSDLIYSGVGKSTRELTKAIQVGIHQINVESIPELKRIIKISKELSKKPNVSLRINPDVIASTHKKIATGGATNKFGIVMSEILMNKNLLHEVNFVGLSVHVGSMIFDSKDFTLAFEALVSLYQNLKTEFKSLTRLDFGGGIGIHYDRDDIVSETKAVADYFSLVKKMAPPELTELQFEPGRFIVAHAGILICQVEYLKKGPLKNFLILNSGMNHLIRPAMYGATHRLFPLNENRSKPIITVDVVGPICETGDLFLEDISIPELSEGESVAFIDAGAYGFSMSSTYNSFSLPNEVVIP